MDEHEAAEAGRGLAGLAPAAAGLSREARERADGLVAEHLRSLPDAEDHALFAPEGGAPGKVVLITKDSAYVVGADVGAPADPSAAGLPRVRLSTTRWPYEAPDWRVALESVAAGDLADGASGYRTTWAFDFAGKPALRIEGEVYTDPRPGVNREERFARTLAAKVGFSIH
jgi:hypothetical protein